jgi:hypothetical protein
VVKNTKFAEMQVGDRVEFIKEPLNGTELEGTITALDSIYFEYVTPCGKTHSLRRNSVILDKRTRTGGKSSIWRFE